MDKEQTKKFLEAINKINRQQDKEMSGFVAQKNSKLGKEVKFEWDDRYLIDYIDLNFAPIEIFEKDRNKAEDNTYNLIKPINFLINSFNNRKIIMITIRVFLYFHILQNYHNIFKTKNNQIC